MTGDSGDSGFHFSSLKKCFEYVIKTCLCTCRRRWPTWALALCRRFDTRLCEHSRTRVFGLMVRSSFEGIRACAACTHILVTSKVLQICKTWPQKILHRDLHRVVWECSCTCNCNFPVYDCILLPGIVYLHSRCFANEDVHVHLHT